MHISVAEAQGQLLELVRRAEAGEEVVLTHEYQPLGVINPFERPHTAEERRAIIREIVGRRKRSVDGWPDAAHSQDFLYDDHGLPA
jgi:antitoxin (DNA-binding transcriptional repressor) of toxin-antitoxin stability system